MLLVYIDDMIIVNDDFKNIIKLKVVLATEFELKDLRKVKYFLTIKMVPPEIGLVLNKRKYILDIDP